ncbi:hypothetical protein SASPL_104771 [Salvia splendens]|uniref:Uncharacterized protein n=1 Tax=Salvia splendens TaxID=180675 RepID=A0A8X8YI47_SALSN|nr:hypothetical protein SASPL_104771 [Salvia splendens]
MRKASGRATLTTILHQILRDIFSESVMNDEFLNRMQEEMEEDLFGKRRSPQLPSPDPTIHKNEGYNHKAKERSSEEDEIKIRQSANESGNNSIIVAGKTEAKGINFTRPHVHDPPCPYCSVKISK